MLSPELLPAEAGESAAALMPPSDMSPSDILRQILDLADRYRQQERSEQNKLLVERLRTIAQQLLASEERELDGAMSGKLSPSAIRRFSGGM